MGQKRSRKIPAKFPTKFPCEKSQKKSHRRASAGAQGEQNFPFKTRLLSLKDDTEKEAKQLVVTFVVFLWSSATLSEQQLSGLLNRLNAMLSLLHPLDGCGTPPPSAIGSAIGRPYLALSRIHAGVLSRLVLNHLGSSTTRF